MTVGDSQLVPLRIAVADTEQIEIINLQFDFWKQAVRYYREMELAAARDDYSRAHFHTDACFVIVLAGTSVSQLLGQQEERITGKIDPAGTPKVMSLFDALISYVAARGVSIPGNLSGEFRDFIRFYDAIRHFGDTKRGRILEFQQADLLNRGMRAALSVWNLVRRLNEIEKLDEISSEFKEMVDQGDKAALFNCEFTLASS